MKLFYNCWFIICLIFGIAISTFRADAQISEKGIPESFLMQQKKAAIIPMLRLDSVRVQKMIESDKKFGIDNRYGVIQQYDINIKEAGVKTEIEGKGNIWRYKIESLDAYSLGIFFKTYQLPQNAKVFIYDSSHFLLRGAFTSKNNNSGNQLPIAEFPAKNLIIEYFEPLSPEFPGELVVGSVSQAYINLRLVADSRIGINCKEGDDWQTEKHSVCLMTFHDLQSSYFCTGALINNVKEDEMPYFLTANHCINSESMVNTLVTYFDYENSTCEGDDASFSQTLAGATFKSGSSYSDFSLLLLNEYPPDEYNPFFAGWDASGTSPSSGVCIHHPEGTPKCISVENNQITSYSHSIKWSDGTGSTISSTQANTHWLVGFDAGNTESGSSGSPLFDQNKRVVGQLHGGSDTESFFSKFSLSWNYSSTDTKQLAHWLDPDNTGTKIIDGMGKTAPLANFRVEVQEVCVDNPVLFFDESKFNPTAWLWHVTPSSYSFVNGTDSTSQNPQILFSEDGIYSVELRASNKYGSTELTQENYIVAKSRLDVQFVDMGNDSIVCGCNLSEFLLVAKGALTYSFQVDETDLMNTTVHTDTLLLTLNASDSGDKSFDTWVKVTGSYGTCAASDSILLHVINQPNDNIANATRLSLGRNNGFSNQCATVETNEPFPLSSGCGNTNSWCPDVTDSENVLNNSIWFTFISPSNGVVTINTNGFDDQIAVYRASSGSSLLSGSSSQYTLLAANDNRSGDNTAAIENLALEPNKQYWLQVDGNNAAYGNLVIDLISNSLEVFPNPSSGIFNLVVSNPDAGTAEVTVSDLNGRKLFTKKEYVSVDSNTFSIDLSGYSSGIYLLNVRINGSNLSKKLVLM